MADIIALSGPQGSGKSTLLLGLVQRDNVKNEDGIYNVATDDFKVSRAVQAQLGWSTLENVLEDPVTMKQFQTAILEQKIAREKENLKRTDVKFVLTERSFADIAAYTQLWCWELAHQNKWSIADAVDFSLGFIQECARAQQVYTGNIYLPSMPHVQWQADPHRAKQEHTQFITDELEGFFARKHPENVPVFRITEGSVQGRIDQVNKWLSTL